MLSLYTETHLEVKPITNASVIEFQIPRKNGSYDKSNSSRQHRAADGAEDVSTYAERHLASSSSFYFRETKHYPRTFAWRIREQRIVEIQPTDLTRSDRDQNEAYLTLSFAFQDSILPLGITFADANNADELHVFVATARNEIFNLQLPTHYFRSSSNISHNVADWCKPVDASSLSIDTAYQLYASSPYELFIAFTGGRIQALRRKADSGTWTQEYYDDSSWGSTLKGIVSRRGQAHIDYGNTRLAATTVQGMVASPDTNYLYTVCLNHTLRVWHLPTGKLVESRDLLDVAREPHERVQLSPSEPALIRLVRHPKSRHPMLVTYTPHEGGQFKFWNVKGGLTDVLVIEDRFPSVKLSPPDPDPTGNTIWSLIGFEIIPGADLKPSQMWVLWRNNNYHQVYSLHFDFPTLSQSWASGWVKGNTTSSRPQAPDLVLSDPQDVASKWLDFLFYPGQYSAALLETALSKYQALASSKLTAAQRSRSLRERLCLVVASSVSLRKYEDAEMDYDRFAIDTDQQWRNFWRLLENMNDDRYAPLSLSYDVYTDMAWIMMADYCTALRECNKMELLRLNDVTELENLEDIVAERWPHRKVANDYEAFAKMANVLKAADSFRRSFTPELMNDIQTSIEEELYVQSEVATPDRIVMIFNQVGFNEGLADGAEEQLLRNLQPAGGIEGVNNDIFNSILDLLSTTTKRPKSNLRNTIFGSNLLSAALLDDILATQQTLYNLLILTIFIDDGENFDPPQLFDQILAALREQERNLWLATHSRLVPLEFLGTSAKPSGHDLTELTSQNGRHVSILEDVLTKSIRPQPAVDRPMMYLVTDLLAEIQNWISGNNAVTPEDAAVHIQCDLLMHDEIELATYFLKFQPSTSWSTYIKGRLRLARNEFDAAGVLFQKAAYTLGCGKAIGDLKEFSAGLLSVLDAEHFNNGLPRYFQHVMELFESKKAFAQVASFARQSLSSLIPGQKDPIPNFRTEILSRLFTAELKCARYNAAYEALIELPDQALQKSSATTLINVLLDPKASIVGPPDALQILQKLPWSVHPQLATHLDQHLQSLAKKQTSIPSVGQWATSGTVDYLSILHALRLSKQDFRGATAVLFERLRIVQRSGRARSEPQATTIRHSLLALINVLTCVDPDEAYILVDADDDPRSQSTKQRRQPIPTNGETRKRKKTVITLHDLRREYQQVLDRCSRIERGDFDFEVDEDSDEEIEDESTFISGMKVNGNTNGDVMEL